MIHKSLTTPVYSIPEKFLQAASTATKQIYTHLIVKLV